MKSLEKDHFTLKYMKLQIFFYVNLLEKLKNKNENSYYWNASEGWSRAL